MRTLLRFVYPPLCLHCEGLLRPEESIFCSGCFALMELIDPEERCPVCFSHDFAPGDKVCAECRGTASLFTRVAAAFDYQGPAASLIGAMKYGNRPYLAKGAGAFLVEQLYRLQWPMPDLLVPVPIPFVRWLQRGFNQSALIAESLGECLDRPVVKAVKRSSGDYSQAGLNRQQRKQLNSSMFHYLSLVDMRNKTVLLVDDVMTTGTTLRCCGEALLEGHPAAIYALTVCRAI